MENSASGKMKILLIEDNPGDVRLVEFMLADSKLGNFTIENAKSVAEATECISKKEFDVILLDLTLPDGKGLSTLNTVQAVATRIPVVVLSGINDEELSLLAVKHGAQDYLVKGKGDGDSLVRSLRYAIERKRSEERMAHLAQYDILTDLPNRGLFRDRLISALARAERSKMKLAVMLLDLDHFKSINDTLGHDAGDELLKLVSERVKTCVRKQDTIGRLGGDEFTVLLPEITDEQGAVTVANKIIAALSDAFIVGGNEVFATTSIGIATYPEAGVDAAELIKHADTALYTAKNKGRSCYSFYDPRMTNQASKRLEMITSLRHAVAREEFVIHYQPQVDLKDGVVIGVEALVRWNHPERGIVYPNEYIHLLEETGLIIPLGEWVLKNACVQTKSWQDKWTTCNHPPLHISVNISAKQIYQKNFLDMTCESILDSGLDPQCLQLELTEGLLLKQTPRTMSKLNYLHNMGVALSVDDFGTGYSALSYLMNFPLDILKLDRSFISNFHSASRESAITRAIIQLGHTLDIKVIAEGVETQEQLGFLQSIGCDAVQGFYFSKPLPGDRFDSWLGAHIQSMSSSHFATQSVPAS